MPIAQTEWSAKLEKARKWVSAKRPKSERSHHRASHDLAEVEIRFGLSCSPETIPYGTFGVEHIPHGKNKKSPEITYLNTGETFGLTILFVNGQYRLGAWGDIVERGNYD